MIRPGERDFTEVAPTSRSPTRMTAFGKWLGENGLERSVSKSRLSPKFATARRALVGGAALQPRLRWLADACAGPWSDLGAEICAYASAAR